MFTPIYLFTHHKCGTTITASVFRDIAKYLGIPIYVLRGWQAKLPNRPGIFLVTHSQLASPYDITWPFRGIHLIRDPRAVIASGYLYHKRTTERWCTNTYLKASSNIMFPQVPYSQEHRSQTWKQNYLGGLSGKSYQQNLLSMPVEEGIIFEMGHYGRWTIETMANWHYDHPNILEIKFETLLLAYNKTWFNILNHLTVAPELIPELMNIVAKHDVSSMTKADLLEIEQVTSSSTTQWEEYLSDYHRRKFTDLFEDVLIELAYETSNNW